MNTERLAMNSDNNPSVSQHLNMTSNIFPISQQLHMMANKQQPAQNLPMFNSNVNNMLLPTFQNSAPKFPTQFSLPNSVPNNLPSCSLFPNTSSAAMPQFLPIIHVHVTPPVVDSRPANRSAQVDTPGLLSAASAPSQDSKKPAGAPRPRKPNTKPVFWSDEDHAKFLEGLEKFGLQESLGADGAELVAMYMGNRTRTQVRSHAQKYYAAKVKGDR